jgi:hypothetical protein
MSRDTHQQGETRTFDELTFSEQATAIKIKALWFLDATSSHIRKCMSELGASQAQKVPHEVAKQLRLMANQIEAIQGPNIQNPKRTTLPFFAYGLFKPGQLGFDRLEQYVSHRRMSCCASGSIWLRDGIPLFEPDTGEKTWGALLYFRDERSLIAYNCISEIEPEDQYYWGEIDVGDERGRGGAVERANVLIGKKPQKGSVGLEGGNWNGRDDPLFKEALDVIEQVLNQNCEFHDDLRKLFRLQMGYLLLWSAIERYAALRYHLGRGVMQKVWHIAEDPTFKQQVAKVQDDGQRWVYRADEPGKRVRFVPSNPEESLEYYYQLRSNMVHRGKSQHGDSEKVRKALSELLSIFTKMLDEAFKPADVIQ